jgi:hypothetical protein
MSTYRNGITPPIHKYHDFRVLFNPRSLRIGVAKGEAGKLEAHAWVESQGRIVIGGLRDLPYFTPLPPL